MEIDKRINDLKIDFTKVVDLKNENVKMFETLEGKIKQLKNIYTEFIKTNKQHLFIFGLDSFHFQGKLIDIEYDDMKRLYAAITNRIYCEYFKLYKIVVDYIVENITDDKKIVDLINVNNNYPIYKDLEPFKQYDFDIIQSVHETVITLLMSIYTYLLHKEHDLKLHQLKNETGLNIDNFIHTFNYNNVVLREKLILFITYIEFFHKLHTKYFRRFTTKMQLFMSQIMHDIKFEDSAEINKTKRKSMMETFAKDNVDNEILIELKHSIVDEKTYPATPTSSESSMSDFNILNINTDKNDKNDKNEKKETSLQDIFLTVEEPVNQVVVPASHDDEDGSSKTNPTSEPEQNPDPIVASAQDEISILTMDSNPSKPSENKPKRKYKPRKKKGE